jgi:hypothetical protein
MIVFYGFSFILKMNNIIKRVEMKIGVKKWQRVGSLMKSEREKMIAGEM